MIMDAQPFPRTLFDRATAEGVTRIELNFSGGSDEGFLSIGTRNAEDGVIDRQDGYSHANWKDPELSFIDALIAWAWSVYEYSGDGDGGDYGDDIIYNLAEGATVTQEWYTEPSYQPEQPSVLEIVDTEAEEAEFAGMSDA